jgi:2-methylisoborneol synthase
MLDGHEPAAVPSPPSMDDLAARLLAGPSGPGTSALRLAGAPAPAPARDTHLPIPYAERDWGDGSYPPLYCPLTPRVDEVLGAEVNRRLVAWAEQVGIYAGRIEAFRDTGFGRLAMLTHADCDDPDLLLAAAQMNAAWWSADDYYADETDLGAVPTELPPRLALIMSALDPPPDAGSYTPPLEEAVASDPVLIALASAAGHLTRHATPAQMLRIKLTTFQMYVSWTAYGAWRYLNEPPPAWRYLAARQHDSFYTSMMLIDVIGGYELPGPVFAANAVHRALMQAGTASVLVNDLHSAAREAADELPDLNMVLLIAEQEECSLREATERTVALHNKFVREFEASQRELAAAVPSVELHRMLRGAQAWMAGCLEWHSSSARYRDRPFRGHAR